MASRAHALFSFSPWGWCVGALLLTAFVFGGGARPGYLSDYLLQFVSLPILGLALLRLRDRAFGRWTQAALAVAGVIAAMPLIQLIPLPPAIWTALPGRDFVVTGLQAAGVEPGWMPLSLSAEATTRSLLSLIPALTVFVATLTLTLMERRTMTVVVILFGVLCVPLGLAQLAAGSSSSFRFFETGSPTDAIGLFANRNHYAALLYSVMPFTYAWVIWGNRRLGQERLVVVGIGLVIVVCLLIGLAMTSSRTGVVLAMVAAIAALFMALNRTESDGSPATRLIFAGSAVGICLALQFGLVGLFRRFDKDPLEDLRVDIYRTSMEAAGAVAPVGSGYGTFVPYYAMHEEASSLTGQFINHAHNDWIELWMEGGMLSAAAATAFLAVMTGAAVGVWRSRDNGMDTLVAKAATIAVGLLLLHSLVDYPLRTTALMSLLAFCAAAIVDLDRPEPQSQHSRRRRRSAPFTPVQTA